ncbi:unnamed protein product [Knipowitschia caucasica]
MMRSVGVVLLISNLSWVISAPLQTETKELQYLIEPPVFAEVSGRRGDNVTLPCLLKHKPKNYKVKWTKLEPEPTGKQNVVMILGAHGYRPYGRLGERASPRNAHVMDVSLQISHVTLEDGGRYSCELIDGLHDERVVVTLSIEGLVFPYQSKHGRYKFTFRAAQETCAENDATLATFDQLYRAWTAGLDWCNAGWLLDGTVQYPIIQPRAACGGGMQPGVRSYGPKDKNHDHFDAFCFTSLAAGSVFYVRGSLSASQATVACAEQGAQLAAVGQMYSAWHFHQLDQCDGGWLRDGSVRFPISNPRGRCGGGAEAGVRFFGFPDPRVHHYGAYCYRE